MAVEVHVGDKIEVNSRQVGGTVRRGQVIEVIATEPLELRVEWDDGHSSVLYPSGGMVHTISEKSG